MTRKRNPRSTIWIILLVAFIILIVICASCAVLVKTVTNLLPSSEQLLPSETPPSGATLTVAYSPEKEALFEELVRCVLRYGGTLDKFLGDGLMALFGAPVSYPDNETRAVCAALDMVESLSRLDANMDQQLDMGTGIAAGEVVVGPLGSSMRANYTAIGDPVNVAARLTALANGRQIIISQPVAERLDQRVQVEALEPARLKGKKKPLPIYRVLPGQKLEVVMRRKT